MNIEIQILSIICFCISLSIVIYKIAKRYNYERLGRHLGYILIYIFFLVPNGGVISGFAFMIYMPLIIAIAIYSVGVSNRDAIIMMYCQMGILFIATVYQDITIKEYSVSYKDNLFYYYKLIFFSLLIGRVIRGMYLGIKLYVRKSRES